MVNLINFSFDIDDTACFTGHRPDAFGCGYDETTLRILEIKRDIRTTIITLIRRGINVFIAGGAVGIDTWSAEAVLSERDLPEHAHIRLIIAKPFESQAARWPQKVTERYDYICDCADYVHVVSEGSYAPWKMQVRNQWMVDHSRIVVPTMLPSTTKGGTFNCVQYAKKQDKELVFVPVKDISG